MADSLVLTGVKDVKKHTGTEMLLTRPKRGGDTHSIKEWWKAGASKCYVECTVFDVTVNDTGTVKLAIDSNMSTNLRIDHDGAFNFTFHGSNEVKRAALFTDAYELIEHYVFPSISGGKVMTVTRDDYASRPTASPPATSISTVNVTGNVSPIDGETQQYSVDVTGDAGGLTYAWSASGNAVINGSSTGTTANFDVSTGASTISCQVTSSDAGVTDSPANGSISISTAAKTIETVTVSGEENPTDGATEAYTVNISGNADDATYVLTSSEAGDTVSGLEVTFNGSGARTLTVTVTATASDTGATGTLTATVA